MEIRETGLGNQPEKIKGPNAIKPELISRKSSEVNSADKQAAAAEENLTSVLSSIKPEKLLKDEKRLMQASLNKQRVNIGLINTMINTLDGN